MGWKLTESTFNDLIVKLKTDYTILGPKRFARQGRFSDADEDVVVQVIKNTYKFIDEHIDKTLPKEHIGYIVDRIGYQVFSDKVLEGIKLNADARVAKHIQWGCFRYSSDVFLSD